MSAAVIVPSPHLVRFLCTSRLTKAEVPVFIVVVGKEVT